MFRIFYLGIATFLTISTQLASVNKALPRVAYIKAIDFWMITCFVFIFGTLVEFAMAQVNKIYNSQVLFLNLSHFVGSR